MKVKFTKEIKAGLIAILAIVGFVILFQFMKGKSLFTTDDVYYVKYDNVEGLEPSSAVSINGLKVGKVDQIVPQTDAKGRLYFVVKITVDDDFSFSRNSTIEIFEPGIMAGKEVRVNLVYGGVKAQDGDTLQGAFKLSALNSISSQVKPVKDQVSTVLLKLDSTVASVNKIVDEQNRQEIKVLLMSLNNTVASVRRTSDQTNRLLAMNERRVGAVLDNANRTMISANDAVNKYGNIAENVDVQKLNATVDNLSKTSRELNSVIAGIQNGEGSLGKLAKDEELYQNLNETSANLNLLIQDIKANPKKYLNFSVFGKVKP